MSAKEFSEFHTVPYYEADVTNHVTIAMLLNILILISEHQNKELGVDHTELINNYSSGWIVTSYSIKITEMPTVESKIKVTTRGTSYNKYFAYREFWVHDESGAEMVKVDSIWVLMNEETRKVQTITDNFIEPYESDQVKKVPRLPRPEKLVGDPDAVKQYQVRSNDIDFNGHVNNSHYLEWMVDVLPMDFLISHQPVQTDIRFENEVKYGQIVESKVSQTEVDDKVKTVHLVTCGGNISAIATIVWKKVKD
ncbi:acyl-ACP thioesterase domain-containing protein [Lentilactobacillus sp. Marseille-Q4993]|uniref:acyl-[acyl-carrier-protein] thioesterase n=1 Tax=Lentilactobacillus sp. Marseille-Q4993 TaxID=3039492 RepID=UPI0024BC0D4A|nr:acyl-ACP thioesterase domain-containing protein [Lentilactobacillus sp. Marseille-Q4993]